MNCDGGAPNEATMQNSGNSPTNAIGPYFKEIDTIPPGESRVQFSFTAGPAQPIFANPKSATVEICEVFFQSVGSSVVTILSGGVPITPAIELYDSMGYDDSGFLLPQGQSVALTVTGAGTVSGFVRWRYQ